MERFDRDLLKIFLAALLMLAEKQMLMAGTLIAAAALAGIHFLKLLQPLFPKRLFRLAVILSAAAFFQTGYSLNLRFHLELSPLWIASFWLLLDWRDYDAKSLVSLPIPTEVRILMFESLVLILAISEKFFPAAPVLILGPLVIAMIVIGLFREVLVAGFLKMKKGKLS